MGTHEAPKPIRRLRTRHSWLFFFSLVGGIMALGTGTTYAVVAATSSPVHHAAFFACIDQNGAGKVVGPITGHPMTCPAGQILAEDNNPGPAGPTGPAGKNGTNGANGSSGVTAPPTVTLVPGTTLTAIGGSWSTGHTVIKSGISLSAGTYNVTLTGDFYKVATTTATPVLQIQLNGGDKQLTAYTSAFPYNAAEAVGLGTDGTPNGLEQTASISGVVRVTAGQNLEIDAFGYNADRSGSGGGDFGVITTVSFQQVG